MADAAAVALPLDVKAEKQKREEKLREEHSNYLQNHPEVELLLQDFISGALVEQPVDVFDFARGFFSTAPTAPPPAEMGAGDTGEVPEGSDQVDQAELGDLDDVEAMADAVDSELALYLKQVFESIDVDSSGTISQAELKRKLQADDQVQQLVGAAGGAEWS
eukprot:6605270-Prymnesium_polylepis.1